MIGARGTIPGGRSLPEAALQSLQLGQVQLGRGLLCVVPLSRLIGPVVEAATAIRPARVRAFRGRQGRRGRERGRGVRPGIVLGAGRRAAGKQGDKAQAYNTGAQHRDGLSPWRPAGDAMVIGVECRRPRINGLVERTPSMQDAHAHARHTDQTTRNSLIVRIFAKFSSNLPDSWVLISMAFPPGSQAHESPARPPGPAARTTHRIGE